MTKGNQKIEFNNFSGNLGKNLINAIYKEAYKLEVNQVNVILSKYNKFATCELFDGENCISWKHTVSI